MKIKSLTLYTNSFLAELKFYQDTLGFQTRLRNESEFSVKIGWSELVFKRSDASHCYHYCFLIPANQLNEALNWMEKRTEIIKIEGERKIQNFESWNADSFYFYDASGNIAEFIVRYDLEHIDESPFDARTICGINEIGLPTRDIQEVNDQLCHHLKTEFWKGDYQRFGTNGSLEGLFLLPNYKVKEEWFPTNLKIRPEPFSVLVENKRVDYKIDYRDEFITITKSAD